MRYGLPIFRKGEVISARALNTICEVVQRIAIQPPSPGASDGLEVTQDASGTRLRVVFPDDAAGLGLIQLGSSLGPATGTWPTLTPTTVTGVTIYQPSGGSLVALPGTFEIFNWRNVTWAASKTTFVVECADGSWMVIDQDC